MDNCLKVILILLLASSCKTAQPSIERHTKDSTIIREVPVIVEVPGAAIQSPSINIDSLVSLLRRGVKPDVITNTLIKEDPETKLKVGILIDELGNLSALCEQQDRMIEVLSTEVEHWRERYERATVVEKVPWWKKILNNAYWIVLGIIFGWIVAAILLFRP